MKKLKYNLCTKVNHGTAEAPVWEEFLSPVIMGWNEINEEIAKREAHNGEYTIEDDGTEEPVAPQTTDKRLAAVEKAVQNIPALIAAAIKTALNK